MYSPAMYAWHWHTHTHTQAHQDLEKYFQIQDQNKQVLTELDPWNLSNNCYQSFLPFPAILLSLVKAPVIPLSRRAPPKVNKEHLSSTLSDILTFKYLKVFDRALFVTGRWLDKHLFRSRNRRECLREGPGPGSCLREAPEAGPAPSPAILGMRQVCSSFKKSISYRVFFLTGPPL